MDQARMVKQHTAVGNSAEAWASCSRDLLAAATVLRDRRENIDSSSAPVSDVTLHPAELMLSGMAIECLLKAVWVKHGNKLTMDGKYNHVSKAGGHDLVQLAAANHLIFSDAEQDTLRRLSHFIEYGGRYPVPTKAEKLKLVRSRAGGLAASTTWNTPSDYIHLNAVVNRLNQLLDESLPAN